MSIPAVDLPAIVQRRKRGETLKEIAADYGVSHQAVFHRLNHPPLHRFPLPPSLPPAPRDWPPLREELRVSKPLPARQRDVLYFIIQYKTESGGDSPTVREIAEAVGATSTSNVTHLLKQLERRGIISRPFNTPRCIAVPGGRWVYDPQETA